MPPLDKPVISHPPLQEAWDSFYNRYRSSQSHIKGMKLYEAWIRFLKDYDEPGLLAYELTFHGMGYGPVSFTRLYVALDDTVVEDLAGEVIRDNDMNDEAYSNESKGGRRGGGEVWRIVPFETDE
jgi:hypothetical protein